METREIQELGATAGAATTAVEEAKGISLLREAEQRRDEASDSLFLDVPSWGGDLVAEYRMVDRGRLEKMARRIMQEARNGNQSTARTAADIDLILAANVGLYARDPDGDPDAQDGGRVPLLFDGSPSVYGNINEILHKDKYVNSARSAVMYLFAKPAEKDGPPGDAGVPISAHALTIARWMRDPSKTPAELEATG
jgi:hypothetical protein